MTIGNKNEKTKTGDISHMAKVGDMGAEGNIDPHALLHGFCDDHWSPAMPVTRAAACRTR